MLYRGGREGEGIRELWKENEQRMRREDIQPENNMIEISNHTNLIIQ